MIIDRLKSMLQDQFTPIDREWIQKAYAYAEKAYAGQQRTSGESFLNHCTAVATILMELNVTPVMVVGGLLHDLPHCPGVSIQDIRREFGEEAAGIIEGVLNLSNLPMISRAEIFLESGEAASDRDPSEMLLWMARASRFGDTKPPMKDFARCFLPWARTSVWWL